MLGGESTGVCGTLRTPVGGMMLGVRLVWGMLVGLVLGGGKVSSGCKKSKGVAASVALWMQSVGGTRVDVGVVSVVCVMFAGWGVSDLLLDGVGSSGTC